MKKLIMIPYADIKTMRGGVNIDDKERLNIYMKNCCVALLSAKHYNPDSDVALVTNIDVPNEFTKLLKNNDIIIINAEFNEFRFSDEYKWGLAFYKLCALKYIIENYAYDYISYMDSDVYIQSSFDNIWNECKDNLLLYDINHGLQVIDCFLRIAICFQIMIKGLHSMEENFLLDQKKMLVFLFRNASEYI